MRRPEWTKDEDTLLGLCCLALLLLALAGIGLGFIDAQR